MDNIHSTPLSKAFLTAVFAGLVTTLLCIVYDTFYRGSTGFSPSYIINVSTILFFVTPLFMVIGIIFFGFLRIKRGELLYIILIALITIIVAVMAGHVHRSEIPLVNTEFHQLLVPIVVIMGLAASLGIPFLFHNKKFEEHVL
jgi:hypothetical protein